MKYFGESQSHRCIIFSLTIKAAELFSYVKILKQMGSALIFPIPRGVNLR